MNNPLSSAGAQTPFPARFRALQPEVRGSDDNSKEPPRRTRALHSEVRGNHDSIKEAAAASAAEKEGRQQSSVPQATESARFHVFRVFRDFLQP